MILWELFSTFFGIGAVSFGGGYGMISLVREAVVRNGWLNRNFWTLLLFPSPPPAPWP